MRKVIVLDTESEKAVTAVCDLALKGGGLQAFAFVNQIVSCIKEEEESVANG